MQKLDIIMGVLFDNCTYILPVWIQLAGSLFSRFSTGGCIQIISHRPVCNTKYLRNFFLPYTFCLHNFSIHDFLLLVHCGVSLSDGMFANSIFGDDPFLLYKKAEILFR